MRHNQTRSPTSSSVTIQVKPGVSKQSRQNRDLVVRRSRLQERAVGEPSKMSKASKEVPSLVQHQELEAFLKLLDDDVIQDFLWMDSCCRIADKFSKKKCPRRVNWQQVFACSHRYLANDMEEDEEQYKYEIFPWALGNNWRKLVPNFLKLRLDLWAQMNYRAAVSRRCCEEVIATIPCHYIWHRDRPAHHSGAVRSYLQKELVPYPQGPSGTPPYCILCNRYRCFLDLDSDSSSSSPENSVLLEADWPQDLLILSPAVLMDHGIEGMGSLGGGRHVA
ncbi:hypothetical protein scyTo_0022710 [Scyliorhinus torazame]|uniref:Uncharacterized protein n=1 Tax=Scyliorhinus torazame TaxID=75743 RepID=A0A401Q5Z7_SCYTO|nr:hypothetical protein [Scyliorhinus torazame]